MAVDRTQPHNGAGVLEAATGKLNTRHGLPIPMAYRSIVWEALQGM
ncbi:MAG: hypothetical protein IKZ17_01330 [Bacteroidaceae bacterium]|nr:hypothetical protein [Bacteroidaceae bacterium]